MNNPTPQITNTKFIELLKTYWAWRRLWIATTILFAGIGLVYVLFLKSDMWVASQGLIVRDEANGAVMRLGRFQSQTEMKAAQETILEMARNTQVLREALLEVGPAKSLLSFGKMTDAWPSQREVSELAKESIGVRAPQGAEFGTTEVIYLDIKQSTRDRALDLNKAVCGALDNRLRQVRVARADGVINELVRASNMATDDLQKAAEQLQLVEREAGADLADLRGLSEANGSGSAARNQLENVKTELRQVETQHASLQSDLALLKETQEDPSRILSAPASILQAHPGLRKLREGLADAQLNTSQLRGRFTGSHPLLYVATSAESEIKQQLKDELALATSNSEREVSISQARVDKLKRQQQQLEERLERLARIRTEHERLNQEVRSRTKILQDAEKQLADTRAARDAALTTSLLTRIDDAVLGERPVGPGRSTILAAMTMAGLCFGLGIVFLLTPLDGSTPDSGRWNEQLGRRLSDRFPWLADQSPNGAPRRRRSDVDRRSADKGPAARSSAAQAQNRRRSDELRSDAKPVMTAPKIEQEDPSVATRLEEMLRSELAALAPVAVTPATASPTVANQVDNVSSSTTPPAIEELSASSLEQADGDSTPVSSPDVQSVATEIVTTQPAAVETVAVAVAETPQATVSESPTSINMGAENKSDAEFASDPAIIDEGFNAQTSVNQVHQTSINQNSVNQNPIHQSSANLSSTKPASVVPTKPVDVRTRDSQVIKPRMRSPEQSPAKPSQPANRPSSPSTKATSAAPASTTSSTATSLAAQATRAEAPTAQAKPPQSPTPAAQEPSASKPVAQTAAKSAKVMFRPNQSVTSDSQPSRPTGFQAPPEPPKPKPIAPANGFETPVEGGLAGIGMPTQKLPDSFEYRQGLR